MLFPQSPQPYLRQIWSRGIVQWLREMILVMMERSRRRGRQMMIALSVCCPWRRVGQHCRLWCAGTRSIAVALIFGLRNVNDEDGGLPAPCAGLSLRAR